jgi:diguanylate cyclase (GGDEF)-like protein
MERGRAAASGALWAAWGAALLLFVVLAAAAWQFHTLEQNLGRQSAIATAAQSQSSALVQASGRGPRGLDAARASAQRLSAELARLRAQRGRSRFLASIGFISAALSCAVVVLFAAVLGAALRRAAHYRHHSFLDPLTSVANRRGAIAAIEKHLRKRGEQPFGVIFLDLDGFKKINDVFGHAAGDAILQTLAMRLQHEVRDGDEVCRLGGDEFVCVVAPPATPDEIRSVARRLRKAAAAPYTFGGDDFIVGCSFGLSIYPLHGTTAQALLQNADRAMYDAKESGGGVREAHA